MKTREERILVLCKTYPSPSAKYSETSCVAGITEPGNLIRLYPVPFRLVNDEQQFKKWQWISARIKRSPDDRRTESYRLYVDTIRLEEVIPSRNEWALRRPWLDRLPLFEDFETLELARQQPDGPTLALLKPEHVLTLDIKPVGNPNWTQSELDKLRQLQNQGSLFEETDRDLRLLRKLPYDFHFRYQCNMLSGPMQYRHKIVDWEVGALFWNLKRAHGQNWEKPFRAKIEQQLPSKDLMFLMGTIHRFPDQWLIVSLFYPPKLQPDAPVQESLFSQ